MSRAYHSSVIAKLDDISNSILGEYKRTEVIQKGIMCARFGRGIDSFQMIHISGDVLGVTGYTREEFQSKDVIKLLKLRSDQLFNMLERLNEVGFCAKNTTFTKKNGEKIRVSSIIQKVSENIYEEITVLENAFIEL
jgi:xylose isomerase